MAAARQQQHCTNGGQYGCGEGNAEGHPAARCHESEQYGATAKAKVDEDTGGPGGTASL